VRELELNLSVRDVLRAVQREVESVEGGDGQVLPCSYCGEFWAMGDEKPWVRPLVEVFGFEEEEAKWTNAWDFIELVQGRGAELVDPISGLEILVDGTGGDTRVVLAEMASVFDDMIEGHEKWGPESPRQPVGFREDWERGVFAGRRTV
jgi:hypothetical protein